MFLLRNQQRNVERARKHRFPPSSTPYLIPFLAFSLSFPIRTNVSSFSARKDPSRGFSIPFSTRVEPRMNAYIYIFYMYICTCICISDEMRGESRVHASSGDTYMAESCGRVRIYTDWLRGIHVRGT